MNKRIVIGVAAVAGAVGLLYIMKRQTSQATNTAAANTSGSASALLGGLLSGWAQPASTVPAPAVVAANGNASAATPSASLGNFTVGGGGSTLQPKPVSMSPTPTPAPKPAPAPAPAPVAAPAPVSWDYNPSVKDLLTQLIPGYNVTDKDAHYWSNHGGIDAVKSTFGAKTTTDNGERFA